MKTNPLFSVFTFSSPALLGFVITVALVQPMFGAPRHALAFTENSPTHLAVTYD